MIIHLHNDDFLTRRMPFFLEHMQLEVFLLVQDIPISRGDVYVAWSLYNGGAIAFRQSWLIFVQFPYER